jgi:TonB-linked SusC/RagA family outer membrane protein
MEMHKRTNQFQFIALILFFMLFCSAGAMAQQTVSGTVADAQTGNPLPGVNILIVGTSTGAATDAKGHYSINVPSLQDTLRFSFIGYKRKTVPIDGRTRIDIKMKSHVISGQQVVVTALGVKQQERSLAYNTKQVSTKEITEVKAPNLINSLEGKVAGLSISQSGGGLGAPSRVTLRGNRSINGNNQPLYVIDGVPTLGKPEYLTSDKIASINVIKGANGAALYGSAAQNGAIIITTKKGQQGKPEVSFNNTFMLNQAVLNYPLQNVYGQGSGGVYKPHSELSWGPKMEGQKVVTWSQDPADAGKTYTLTPQPNNINDLFDLGYNLSNNVQISLGNKLVQGYFSVSNTKAKGILPNANLQRNNLDARVTGSLPSNKFTWDAKISYTRQKTNGLRQQSYRSYNPMLQILSMPRSIRTQAARNFEYVNSEGVMAQNFWAPNGASTSESPYWLVNRTKIGYLRGRITGRLSFTYNITKALSLMIRSSYDEIDRTRQDKIFTGTRVRAPHGRYTVTKGLNYDFNSDFLFSYKTDFGNNWALNVRAGGNIEKKLLDQEFSSNTGPALLVPNFFALSNTNNPKTSFDPGAASNVQSLYGLAKVSWKDAIYLNFTGRNDWSSTLPAGNRSYFYPSAGLSVILSDLIPSFPKAFNFARVRFSFAQVGSGAPPYKLVRTATFSSGGNNGFLSLDKVLPNTTLKPEQTKSLEGGLDIQFVQNRLGFGFTYFKTNTTNQLFQVELPVTSGASSFFTNGGNVQDKGFELALNSTPIQTENITWNVDANFSHINNVVKHISDQRPKILINGPASHYFSDYVVQQGKPFGQMFSTGFKKDDKGRVIVNSKGLPELTSGRSYNMGIYMPDWKAGVTSTFSYKGWSFHFLITHRQGGHVGSATLGTMAYNGELKETLKGRDGSLIFGKNIFTQYTAVKEDGSSNDIPVDAQSLWQEIGNGSAYVGEAFDESTTNTRLKEMELSYRLPESILKNTPLTKIEISLVGRDLFFIHRVSPSIDPDILPGTGTSVEGFSSFPPPTRRSFGINIKMTF